MPEPNEYQWAFVADRVPPEKRLNVTSDIDDDENKGNGADDEGEADKGQAVDINTEEEDVVPLREILGKSLTTRIRALHMVGLIATPKGIVSTPHSHQLFSAARLNYLI